MKLWMYKLNCHNARMTRVDYIVGVIQAENYNAAERKIAQQDDRLSMSVGVVGGGLGK